MKRLSLVAVLAAVALWAAHPTAEVPAAQGRLVEAAPQEWRIEMDIRLYRDRAKLGAAADSFWAAVLEASVK